MDILNVIRAVKPCEQILLHQFCTGQAQADIILAVGPVQKQPNTNPYRIVLRLVNGYSPEFVVHTQIWLDEGDLPLGVYIAPFDTRSEFDQGDYFPLHRFAEATVRFAERLAKDAKAHYTSVYRQQEQPA